MQPSAERTVADQSVTNFVFVSSLTPIFCEKVSSVVTLKDRCRQSDARPNQMTAFQPTYVLDTFV